MSFFTDCEHRACVIQRTGAETEEQPKDRKEKNSSLGNNLPKQLIWGTCGSLVHRDSRMQTTWRGTRAECSIHVDFQFGRWSIQEMMAVIATQCHMLPLNYAIDNVSTGLGMQLRCRVLLCHTWGPGFTTQHLIIKHSGTHCNPSSRKADTRVSEVQKSLRAT